MTWSARTTRYNETSVNSESRGYLLLTRYPESFALSIRDDGGDVAYLEISPAVARRLVENLTAGLKHNGQWKDAP